MAEEIMVQNADAMADGRKDVGPTFRPENGPYERLVRHCQDLYKLYSTSTYREAKLKELEEARKVYEQKSDKKDMPWEDASNIVLPLTTITVDNLEPRIVSGLVGRSPIARFEMVGQEQQTDVVKMLEAWFNQELKDVVGMEKKVMGMVHTLLLEGTFFALCRYNRDELVRRDFTFDQAGNVVVDMETGEPQIQDKVDVLFDGGEILRLPFSDVLCADDVGTVEEWERRDKGFISRPTYAELQRDKARFGYLPDKIGPWLLDSTSKNKKLKGDELSPEQKVMDVEVTGKEVVTCVNWYLTYPINRAEEAPDSEQTDFTEERIFVTIAKDSGVLIRFGILRDFVFSNEPTLKRIRLFPEEGRTYGTGIYGKMKAIQTGCSDLFNTVVNIAMVCMIPWYFYQETSGLKGDNELYPGKGVKVDDVRGILIPDFFKLNPANYLRFVEIYIELWERLGNISNPQIGRPADTEKTATEILSVIQEGNVKFDYQARTTQDEFIIILQCLYDLYYQNMPFGKQFNWDGRMVLVPRTLMKQRVKFRVTGSTAAVNKMIERKEAEEIDNLAAGNPLLNPVSTLEDRLRAYGKTDMGKYIKPEVRQLLAALVQNPELPKVVAGYLKTKADTANAVGATAEGIKKNVGGAFGRPTGI